MDAALARTIAAEPLTPEAFAPWGDVLEARVGASFPINAGMCDRFHDLARMEFAGRGRPRRHQRRPRPPLRPAARAARSSSGTRSAARRSCR